MVVSIGATGLARALVLVLLAGVGVLSLHLLPAEPPADACDAVEEQFYQRIHTINRAMVDADKRGDEKAQERLRVQFHEVLAEYARHFRERCSLPDSPPEKQPCNSQMKGD
jgi:hypothetical protein